MKIKPKHLFSLLVFLLALTILLTSATDYGLTWDEPYYIAHSNRLQQWFGLLLSRQNPLSDDAVSNLLQFDRYHNCHPPFYKLSALFFKNLLGKYIFSDLLSQYRVSTIFWSALLVATLFLYQYQAYQSYLIAFLGAGLFFTIPRFFVHMHLFATDAVIVSLYFLALYLFVFGPKSASAVIAGFFGGALLASKFTGVLLFPMILIIAPCFSDRKTYLRRLIFFTPAAILSFIVFDIHVWAGLRQEILFYFRSVLDRESVVPIGTLFFGKVYDFRLPWYQPLVMLGISIPLSIVVFAILGLGFDKLVNDRKFWFFEILPLVFLILVFSLPRTPKHDGIRLFSLVWPHLVLLSVRGICGVCKFFNQFILKRMIAPESTITRRIESGFIPGTVLSLILLTNTLALIDYHPYQLAYYNLAIGKTAGAARKGFTVSYWYDALEKSFLAQLNALAEENAIAVYSFPNSAILEYNRVLGLVDSKVKTTIDLQAADYILVLNRIIRQGMSNFLQDRHPLIKASTPDGEWIISLFDNHPNRQSDVSNQYN